MSSLGDFVKLEDFGLPSEIINEADQAISSLVPKKSAERYETEFSSWESWSKEKNVNVINETVLLAYFSEMSKKYQCSSLWSKFSMIKKMLMIKKNINIGSYHKLISFLKSKNVGHEPKKAMVLSKNDVIKFIMEAENHTYLMLKVALVFGIYGACRRNELAQMSVNDIEDRGSVLVVTVPKTKTNKKRVFTVIDDSGLPVIFLYRKYFSLRPASVSHSRFFLFYKNNSCTVQPVGKNTFGSIPKGIAQYLNLPHPEKYTGHTFRRTSATMLADSGADITSLKRHGGWKSSSVAEGYLEDSIESKNKIARSILSTSENLNINNFSSEAHHFESKTESEKPESPMSENVNKAGCSNLNISTLSSEAHSFQGITFQNTTNCVFNFNK